MTKIIVSIATLGSGGAERVLSVLSKPLADTFNVVLYVLWEGGEPFYPIDERVKIVALPEQSGKKGRRNQMGTFRRLIKQERPNLVLSFLTPYNILVLLSTLGIKQKIVVAERTDPNRLLAGGRAGLWIRDFLYRRAYGILTQTAYAKSVYDRKFEGKTYVIYNPVTMTNEQVGMALRTKKEQLFVTAGRLDPVKDQAMMIEAFARFQDTHPNYRMVIYGEGPIREELQQKINDIGLKDAVTLAGRTNDLWNKMVSAECFLLTSEYEGMSNALIEAMCLGLPVISTKVAGATDLVEDGKNGYLINVKDISSLTDRMTRIADDVVLRERMGVEAAKVYELLKEDKVCEQWIDYLQMKIKNS